MTSFAAGLRIDFTLHATFDDIRYYYPLGHFRGRFDLKVHLGRQCGRTVALVQLGTLQ